MSLTSYGIPQALLRLRATALDRRFFQHR